MRSLRRVLVLGLIVFALGSYLRHVRTPSQAAGTPAEARSADQHAWRPVARGIEARELRWPARGGARVLAVRAAPGRCHIRVVDARQGYGDPGATSDDACPPKGAAINASFFEDHATLKPLGLLICDGTTVQRRRTAGEWGIFAASKRRAVVTSESARLSRRVTQAIQSKPRLVVGGRIPGFKPQPGTHRAAVGVDGQGRVVLAATDGRLTLAEWASCVRDALGCPDALNLDGGPSAQLTVGTKPRQSVRGGWPVPVLIVVQEGR